MDRPDSRTHLRAQDRLRRCAPTQRAGILQAMALTEEPGELDGLGLAAAAGWTPLWSYGYRSAFHLRLVGHTADVRALALCTVSGRAVLASGGGDRTIRLWDAGTGEPVRVLTGHAAAVVALAFGTPDDRPVLASAAHDGTFRSWDPDTGSVLATITVRGDTPTVRGDTPTVRGNTASEVRQKSPADVAFAMVGGREVLVTATADRRDDGGVHLWDPVTGEGLATLFDDSSAYAVAVVPVGGRSLVAAITLSDEYTSRVVRLWDPATGEALAVWENTTEPADDRGAFGRPLAVVSVEDRMLVGAIAYGDCASHEDRTCGTALWWDVATGEEVLRRSLDWDEVLLAATDGRVATTKFHRNRWSGETWGPDVAVGPYDGWRSVDMQGHTEYVGVGAFGTSGGRTVLATGGGDRLVLLWDADTEHRHPAAWGRRASGLAVVDDGASPILAVGTGFSYIDLRDPLTGADRGTLSCGTSHRKAGHVCDDETDHCREQVAAAAVDGRTLVATSGENGGVPLWDPKTAKPVRTLGDSGLLAFGTVDGRTLLATGSSSGIHVWDAASGDQVAVMEGRPLALFGASSITFAPAGARTVLVTGGPKAVLVWDPLTGQRLRYLCDQDRGLGLGAGRDLIACAHNDHVHLFQTSSGQSRGTVRVRDGLVTCVAVVAAGDLDLLVTGTANGTVRLWDATTLRHLSTLAAFARPVHSVAAAIVDGRPCVFAQCVSGRLVAGRLDEELTL
jgi:WD40 repeat protein